MANVADEFTKLQQLLASSAISDVQFSQAIRELLDGNNASYARAGSETDMPFAELQGKLALIDQQWQEEQEQYKVSYGKYSPRTVPNEFGTVMSLFGGIAIVAFGIYWMLQASKSSMPGFFPMLGCVGIASGIGLPIYHFKKYSTYKSAYSEYQRRRSNVLEHFERTFPNGEQRS
jgi:hypothetical protein